MQKWANDHRKMPAELLQRAAVPSDLQSDGNEYQHL